MERSFEAYFRQNRLPHLWCPGCGNGIVMKAIVQAIEKEGLTQDNTVIVSGIGCSSRASGYMDFDTLHTAHGRAIPFATGVKLANPELNVVVITGDGDCTAIGGNHFIHGCRRNVDLTVVLFDNNIYGMTGGQASPMTPTGKKATTAPYGSVDRPFNACALAGAAGATYVARSTAFHVKHLTDMISGGLRNKGFSFIFCGSMVNAMKEIFESSRLFYRRVTRVRLSQADEREIADHVVKGFLAGGKVLDKDLLIGACRLFKNNFWYINHFASICNSMSKGYIMEPVLVDALSCLISVHEPRFRSMMNGLTTFQVSLLRATVEGNTRFSASEVIRKYNLNSSANVKRVKDALMKKEILTFDSEDKPEFLDPLFEYWIKKYYFEIPE